MTYLNTRQSESYPQAVEILREGASAPSLYAVPLGGPHEGLHAVYVRAHFNSTHHLKDPQLLSQIGGKNPLRGMIFTPHRLEALLAGIEARVERLQNSEAKSRFTDVLAAAGFTPDLCYDVKVEVGTPYQPFDPGIVQRFLSWNINNHPIVGTVKLWHIILGDDKIEFRVELCRPPVPHILGNGYWKTLKGYDLDSVIEQVLDLLESSRDLKNEEECKV